MWKDKISSILFLLTWTLWICKFNHLYKSLWTFGLLLTSCDTYALSYLCFLMNIPFCSRKIAFILLMHIIRHLIAISTWTSELGPNFCGVSQFIRTLTCVEKKEKHVSCSGFVEIPNDFQFYFFPVWSEISTFLVFFCLF